MITVVCDKHRRPYVVTSFERSAGSRDFGTWLEAPKSAAAKRGASAMSRAYSGEDILTGMDESGATYRKVFVLECPRCHQNVPLRAERLVPILDRLQHQHTADVLRVPLDLVREADARMRRVE